MDSQHGSFYSEKEKSIPENTMEFLYWLKETTETYWGNNTDGSIPRKWIGMSDADIDLTEKKHNLKFTPDHKLFLKILHTAIPIGENIERESSGFYNWLEDDTQIKTMLLWPYKEVLSDVLKGYCWLDSWGVMPETDKEKETIFATWYQSASKLIPMTGHRFIVAEPLGENNPVLSVWGSDTILYGFNLWDYLIKEFSEIIFYGAPEYDETFEDPVAEEAEGREFMKKSLEVTKAIPGWGDLMLHVHKSWYNGHNG